MNFDAVDGVLFDMDGTLVDSEPHTLAAMEAVLTEHGLGPLTLGPHRCLRYELMPSLSACSTHPQVSSDSLVSSLILHFRRICSMDGATLLPGVLESSRGRPTITPSVCLHQTYARKSMRCSGSMKPSGDSRPSSRPMM